MRCFALMTICLVCLSAAVSPSARAQETASPIWVPYAAEAPTDEDSIRMPRGKSVKIGEPELGQWAIDQAANVEKMVEAELLQWLKVVELYRITEAQPAVYKLIEAYGLQRDIDVTRELLHTLSLISTDEYRDKLKDLLKRIDAQPKDDIHSKRHRSIARLAAALVRLDDDAGRDYLLHYVKQWLTLKGAEQSRWENVAALNELWAVGDKKLLEQVKKMNENPESTQMRYGLEKIIRHMEMNLLPIDELWEKAQDTSGNVVKRTQMIGVLGEYASADDVNRFAKLKPSKREKGDSISVYRAGKEMFERRLAESELVLRCRLWREMKK